jgi:hypothetical protein
MGYRLSLRLDEPYRAGYMGTGLDIWVQGWGLDIWVQGWIYGYRARYRAG